MFKHLFIIINILEFLLLYKLYFGLAELKIKLLFECLIDSEPLHSFSIFCINFYIDALNSHLGCCK